MTEHETGARRGLPGEGTGMTPPPPGFEQPQQVDRMNVLGHCEPVEFEVCERSGQLPWECGLAACENGCATKTVEFVPAATYRGAVSGSRDFAEYALATFVALEWPEGAERAREYLAALASHGGSR